MTNKEEFELWLKKHHDHLKDYNAFELANLASACGFDMAVICPDVSEWVTTSQRRLRLWESPFYQKWIQATRAERGMEESA